MNTTTIRDLADELNVTTDSVETYVDQLINIDGHDAVIDHTEDVTNASGRVIGQRAHLTDDAATFLRDMHAAGSWE